MRASDRVAHTWFLIGRLPLRDQQIPIEDVVSQRRFPRTRNAGYACENAQWKIDVDALQIMLSRANDPDGPPRFSARARNRNGFFSSYAIARKGWGRRALPRGFAT